MARKNGRFQAAIYFAGKPLRLWPRLWYYHYANPRGIYAREGRSKKYYVKQAGKSLKNPKFQVEVSHPKEIHLATCSPSIF
ncbi:hypothetical protein [Streptococcus suis]|uniref:hypothetical protein n=1 Tax=Streptococcus suis TaxID=1307 RepID=UPI0037DA035C